MPRASTTKPVPMMWGIPSFGPNLNLAATTSDPRATMLRYTMAAVSVSFTTKPLQTRMAPLRSSVCKLSPLARRASVPIRAATPKALLRARRTWRSALRPPFQDQNTATAARMERLGSVRSNGAPERPVRFYRLSANCQPTIENLVAGACNPLNLDFSGAAA